MQWWMVVDIPPISLSQILFPVVLLLPQLWYWRIAEFYTRLLCFHSLRPSLRISFHSSPVSASLEFQLFDTLRSSSLRRPGTTRNLIRKTNIEPDQTTKSKDITTTSAVSFPLSQQNSSLDSSDRFRLSLVLAPHPHHNLPFPLRTKDLNSGTEAVEVDHPSSIAMTWYLLHCTAS